jgi:hypothetical protein
MWNCTISIKNKLKYDIETQVSAGSKSAAEQLARAYANQSGYKDGEIKKIVARQV